MRVDEAQRQSQCDNDGREQSELAETGFPVTPLQVEIESRIAQLPDG